MLDRALRSDGALAALELTPAARRAIAAAADGDARVALNALELAAQGAAGVLSSNLPGGESESEDDFEREEAARQAERARKARQAVRTAHRLYAEFEPDKGVCVRCVERASRLEAQDRGLKGLASSEPDGAMERWTGVEDNFYQQRPTFLAR